MDFNRSKKAHFKENTTAFTKKEENETVVDLHRQILDVPSPLFAKFFVIYVQFSGNIGRLAPPPPWAWYPLRNPESTTEKT